MRTTLTIMTALLLSPTVWAEPFACDFQDGDDEYSISIDDSDGYSSQVELNGEELAAVGPCWVSTRPSTRHVRCSHQNDDVRLEVNVWSETTSGAIIRNSAILWRGDVPKALDTDECKKD